MMSRCALLAAALTLAAALPCAAQTASLVRDINPGAFGDSGSAPQQITAAAGRVFFLASEPSSGRELWVSDGTAEGTRLLLDQCPGACDAGYLFLGELRKLLFFVATSGNPADGLWRTDGTDDGTVYLSSLLIGASASLGGTLYFSGCVAVGQCELWRTDGTPEGTIRALDVQHVSLLTTDGHRLFFTSPGTNDLDLWASDGTEAGSARLASIPGAEAGVHVLSLPGEPLFFLVGPTTQHVLWTSDGTPAGTRSLRQFQSVSIDPVHATGGRIYFAADDGVSGQQVWTSDGTPAGTRNVTAFAAGATLSPIRRAGIRAVFISGARLWSSRGTPASTAPLPNPCQSCSFVGDDVWLQEIGDRVLFFGNDGVHGAEPWVTDGTAQGTRLLADLCPGACGSADPVQPVLLPIAPGALFVANDGAHGQELWRTDGTAAGTLRLTDLAASTHLLVRNPGAPLPSQPEAALVGGTVYFGAADSHTPALWASERPATTRRIGLIAPRGASSDPSGLTIFKGKLHFFADDGHAAHLWSSQGTAETTAPIGPDLPFQVRPWEPTVIGNQLFFRQVGADDPSETNAALWRTDGTAAGTLRLKQGGVNAGLTVFQNQLFFPAGAAGHAEIWRSDGAPAGTVKAFDVPDAVTAGQLKGLGTDLYFTAQGFTNQMWKSDGTQAGTLKLADLGSFGALDDPEAVRLGSRVLFRGGGIWASDGTPAGTAFLFPSGSPTGSDPSDLVLFQGFVYFFAGTATARGLWRTDGTPPGTVLVKEFAGGNSSQPPDAGMASAAGHLWFAADDGVHGSEPWTSDGTADGTVMVRDIAPGPDGSFPRGFTAAGGRTFFTATDGEHGFELWQSDGAVGGTGMVQDIAPLAGSSLPDQLTVLGSRLFFTADDGPSGRELWALPLTSPAGCQPSDTVLCLQGGRYRVEARWRDFVGRTGDGHAVPLTADTGTFWFFDAANVEAIVKVLNGQPVNGHVWVFYGALSNVEYTLTVTDTATGLERQYFNPSGQLASVGDTHAFGPLGAHLGQPLPPIATAAPSPPPLVAERQDRAAAVPCEPGPQRLCLNDKRFAVDVSWKDFQGHTGKGTTVTLSGDTGAFWFFSAANIELVVKALDGRPVNGHFWLFYGALSNVEYTLTVTDTQTGKSRTYTNPSGRFASVADTLAF